MASVIERLAAGEQVAPVDVFIEDSIGPGAQACTVVARPDDEHARCPLSGFAGDEVPASQRVEHQVLVMVPWFGSWGVDYACACGLRWSNDDWFEDGHVFPSWDETAGGREFFVRESQHALPAGTELLHDDEDCSDLLTGVALPDGRELSAEGLAFSMPAAWIKPSSPAPTMRPAQPHEISEYVQDGPEQYLRPSDEAAGHPWWKLFAEGRLPRRLGSRISVRTTYVDVGRRETKDQVFVLKRKYDWMKSPQWESQEFAAGGTGDLLSLLDEVSKDHAETFVVLVDAERDTRDSFALAND